MAATAERYPEYGRVVAVSATLLNVAESATFCKQQEFTEERQIMTTALLPISDIERMAAAVAGSGLFGVKTKEQAMSLMLIAQAEGLHPAIAARDYHIIDGRPALKADAMLARFQQAGGRVRWFKLDAAEVSAEFSHPHGGVVTITWTLADAERAGVAGKGNWQKYPRQMLRARVISEGIRTVYPGVCIGVYTPEEVQDIKDMGQAEEIPPSSQQVFDRMVERIDEAADLAALGLLWQKSQIVIKTLPDEMRERLVMLKDAAKLKLDLARADEALSDATESVAVLEEDFYCE